MRIGGFLYFDAKTTENKRFGNDRRVIISLGLLVVSQCVDAFSQNEQRGVDVSSFFQALSFILCLGTSLRAGQVAQTQPEDEHLST